jgi:ABC-type Fe3+/spermidine/putrescine transport system ATPase subunit
MPAKDTAQIDGEPALLSRVRRASKSFPGVRALAGVDLTLRAGEVHATTGESTLTKIIGGEHQPDAGIIEWDGSAVTIGSPAAALRRGIVSISQELTLEPTLTVAENIFLGRARPRASRRPRGRPASPCLPSCLTLNGTGLRIWGNTGESAGVAYIKQHRMTGTLDHHRRQQGRVLRRPGKAGH